VFEIGSLERGAFEVRVDEIGAAKVGLPEVRLLRERTP
jgi:hypothetical protein